VRSEIVIRGHNVMKGYWQRPEETAEAIPDGWFRTGDLGRVDQDGYFAIVDRKKELIIRGGYLLDGFPRTLLQAERSELAERLGVTLNAAAYLYAPEPVLAQRLLARADWGGRADDTVDYHLRKVFRTTGVASHTQLARTMSADRP
jgi:non-ribosomal peptide synthetase component E (peptide arylation enzyme)